MRKKIFDYYHSYLVRKSSFDDDDYYEMPLIGNKKIDLRIELLSFKKIKYCHENKDNKFIHFYMYDECFTTLLNHAEKYIDTFREYAGIISPDFSVYRDMPIMVQSMNTYYNRAVGSFFENRGITVIPNIRWGDERSYKFAFNGIGNNKVVAIGTHGCMKRKMEKQIFSKGLGEMLYRLRPERVIVYGAMPQDVFGKYKNDTEFIQFDSDFSISRSDRKKGLKWEQV